MGKKRIGLIVAALWAVTGLSAQNYQCAVGVRGGVTATGLSVRYHFDPVNALEGMLDFAQGFNIYALYERTIPVIGEGFEFYYGAGANLGSWDYDDGEFTFGVNGIIGLEYKIREFPGILFGLQTESERDRKDRFPCGRFRFGHTGGVLTPAGASTCDIDLIALR